VFIHATDLRPKFSVRRLRRVLAGSFHDLLASSSSRASDSGDSVTVGVPQTSLGVVELVMYASVVRSGASPMYALAAHSCGTVAALDRESVRFHRTGRTLLSYGFLFLRSYSSPCQFMNSLVGGVLREAFR
jgi:hypothetical protein